jgi:hypothetical protein
MSERAVTVRVSLRTKTSQKTRLDETAVTTPQGLWGLCVQQPEKKWCDAHRRRGCAQPPGDRHWR